MFKEEKQYWIMSVISFFLVVFYAAIDVFKAIATISWLPKWYVRYMLWCSKIRWIWVIAYGIFFVIMGAWIHSLDKKSL
jgi:hypothetical protein